MTDPAGASRSRLESARGRPRPRDMSYVNVYVKSEVAEVELEVASARKKVVTV